MFAPTPVSGDPRARGLAHGRALGPLVRGHLDAWRATLGDHPDAWIADLLRDTDFKPAIRRHAPGLLEEVEGIAEGAGVEADALYALQLLDEEWAYRLRRNAAAPAEKCSSLGLAPAGGPTWIGQNMDLGGYTDGFQALLAIAAHDGAPAALVFSTAGMLGLMGVNAAGIGVCVNSLPQLASAAQGVPVAFVLRRLLQARSMAEAVGLVTALPHATNQHYLIAAPGEVRSFEASAAGVVEYRPRDPQRVLHTNHPLAAAATEPESEALHVNSRARLKSLVDRLSTGEPELESIQAALSSCDDPRHPVCRLRDESGLTIGFTTGAMISRLTPGGVDSWVSPGPPSVRGWTAVAVCEPAAV